MARATQAHRPDFQALLDKGYNPYQAWLRTSGPSGNFSRGTAYSWAAQWKNNSQRSVA